MTAMAKVVLKDLIPYPGRQLTAYSIVHYALFIKTKNPVENHREKISNEGTNLLLTTQLLFHTVPLPA